MDVPSASIDICEADKENMSISSLQAVETLLSDEDEQQQSPQARKAGGLSPLKVDLPDTQTLTSMWSRSSAVYERLRLQRLCKRIMHARRREETGIDTIEESPLPKLKLNHGVELSFGKTLGLS